MPWSLPIATERLVIRTLEASDVPAVLRYQTDNADHFAPAGPLRPAAFLTEAHWHEQVRIDRDDAAAGRALRLYLFPRDGGAETVGHVALSNIVRGVAQYCDIGYGVAADRQGAGLMAEAVEAVVRYAFDGLGLHRVKAAYLPTNERSGRLLRRLGFVVEGYARDYLLIQGRWQDMILVGRINPDWRPAS